MAHKSENHSCCGLTGSSTGKRDKVHDLSDWMGALDESLLDVPLNHLAIPGSHNSFTYYLNKDGDIGPDEPQEIANLVRMFGGAARSVIYNWSVTQSLGPLQQLHAGIRYFDIRLAGSSSTNHSADDLHVVHGLYGPKIWACLDEIESFLIGQSTEVVLLDFRAFYNMDLVQHDSFLDRLTERFSSLMCPVLDLSELTLRNLRDSDLRLIVFYHNPAANSTDQFQFWPGCLINSPWPNVTKVEALLGCLDKSWEEGRDGGRFQVTQGVLTPDAGCIVAGLLRTLKSCFAEPLAPKFIKWVIDRESKGEGILGQPNSDSGFGLNSHLKKTEFHNKSKDLTCTRNDSENNYTHQKNYSKEEKYSKQTECGKDLSDRMKGLQCSDGDGSKNKAQTTTGGSCCSKAKATGCSQSGAEAKGTECVIDGAVAKCLSESQKGKADIRALGRGRRNNANADSEGRLWKVNICIIDFIELEDYSSKIVELNARRAAIIKANNF